MGQPFTVTLSDDLAERVREKVRSGEYESVDELIGDALARADDRPAQSDEAIETWLRMEVLERCKRLDEEASLCLTSNELSDFLEEEHRKILAEPA